LIAKSVRKEDIIRILKEETCDHCRYLDISEGKATCLNIHKPKFGETCSNFKKVEDPWTLSDEQVENYRRIAMEAKKLKLAKEALERIKQKIAEEEFEEI
jgi:hypothetical protein